MRIIDRFGDGSFDRKATHRVLGIDPPAAYVILDITGSAVEHVVHGALDTARALEDFDGLLALHRPTTAAIELVDRVYPRRDKGGLSADYATQLYRSGVAAGEIMDRCRVRGLLVQTVTAEEVRKALCGNRQADNAAVLRTVLLRVAGWPRPGKPGQRTSSNHERDAAACAMFVGLRRHLGGMIRAVGT